MTAEDETPEKTHVKTDLPMSANQIRGQLRRILASPVFRATEAQRAFLEFVVEKALAGKSGDIRGFTVATQV